MIPQIICHIMASVDGKVDNSRWTAPYEGYDSAEIMAQYRAIGQRLETDAWLFGTNTVKQFFPERFDGCACHVAFPDQLHTFVGECSSQRLMIALVTEGDVRFTHNHLRGDNIVVVLGEHVSTDYLEYLEDMQISYVFAGKDGTDIALAMQTLHHDFGIRRISLQGGGITNGSFFNRGLVNELSIVVSPSLDGRQGAPSIIDCRDENIDLLPRQMLELLDVERLSAGCVWLHYRVHQG